jgi:hypothetical protein
MTSFAYWTTRGSLSCLKLCIDSAFFLISSRSVLLRPWCSTLFLRGNIIFYSCLIVFCFTKKRSRLITMPIDTQLCGWLKTDTHTTTTILLFLHNKWKHGTSSLSERRERFWRLGETSEQSFLFSCLSHFPLRCQLPCCICESIPQLATRTLLARATLTP